MARVLFVVPRFHPNLYVATRTLRAAGHTPAIFAVTSDPAELHDHLVPEVFGPDPDRVRLRAALDAFDPDLILLRNSKGLSRRVAQFARARGDRIFSYDLRPVTTRIGWRKRLSLWLRGQPGRRVTPLRGLDPDAAADPRAHYLPWPVEAQPCRDIPRPEGRVVILCVGKLAQARKQQDLVIAAIQAAGLETRVALWLAGSTGRDISGADEAHAAALAQAAERHDWITLFPDHPYDRMPDLYAAADVCVLPSLDEPLGIAPVEGMAYGAVPVISTQAGSAGYLSPGEDGAIFDAAAADAARTLGAILWRLVEDPAALASMQEGARATAAAELSPAWFLRRIKALLD